MSDSNKLTPKQLNFIEEAAIKASICSDNMGRMVINGKKKQIFIDGAQFGHNLSLERIASLEKMIEELDKCVEFYAVGYWETRTSLQGKTGKMEGRKMITIKTDKVKSNELLKHFRLKKGLTQIKLASLSGITQPNIASYETGRRPIGLGVAKKLAFALEINYKDLI